MTLQMYIAAGVIVLAFLAGWFVNGWRLNAKIADLDVKVAAQHTAYVQAQQNATACDAALQNQNAAVGALADQLAAARGAADSIALQSAKDKAALQERIKVLLNVPLPADPSDAVREACVRRAALLKEVK